MAKFKMSSIGNLLKPALAVVGIGAAGAAATQIGGSVGNLAGGAISGMTTTMMYMGFGGLLLLLVMKKNNK
jgi:hypothetical protein